MDDFDWNADGNKEDVVIPQVDAVAVYQNGTGNVVIRQQDPMGDRDQFVVIPRGSVNTLIKALRAAAKV